MPDREAPDRLFRNARREALIVILVWALAFAWTVPYCYLRGYQHNSNSWLVQSGLAVARDSQNVELLWGVPDWIVFGIVLPWSLCTFFTIVFGLYIMKDDDLGLEAEEGGEHGS